jgi:uncharacterized damage-inducible protein DinB
VELSLWFDHQLRSTLDGFIWAVQQLGADRLYSIPSAPLCLGEWSAAQHVFHLLEYEEKLALPSMHQWIGGPPVADTRIKQDLPAVEEMLAQLERIRHEEINLLPKFSQEAWNSKQQTTFWGEVSLFWLVCKTYQHTTEHTHDILSLVLFWDRRLERLTHG